MSGLVRRLKQSKAARGTHILERSNVGTGQEIKTKRGSKGTHDLERSDIRTGQIIETKRGSEGDSQPREVRHWDWSGY